MTNEHKDSGEEFPENGAPRSGPESADSGPEPQEDQTHSAETHETSADTEGLTVEDILEAEQTGDAAAADAENPHLEDLRRLSAEYANYRKRTEANAERDKQRATASAVVPLLGVLDDLDRAEKHGDLVEGSAFATIAHKLRTALERLGLESFGEAGEPFDPSVHEAIAQVPTPGAAHETVLDVVERGYRIGDVELRPAKVAVAVGADG